MDIIAIDHQDDDEQIDHQDDDEQIAHQDDMDVDLDDGQQINLEDPEPNLVQQPESITTPRPSVHLHSETPGGTAYWEPGVDEQYIPLQGKKFDTPEKCIRFYKKYAEIAGFEIKNTGLKKTASGLVKSKYLLCNRAGLPQDVNIDTLELKNQGKQVRNTRSRVTGCMARIRFELNDIHEKPYYEIIKFIPKHNHPLMPKHFEDYTSKKRRMRNLEKMWAVKASTMRIGATKAHSMLCKMKGGSQYVHGTSEDFKNHIRDVNAVMGDSDAQMLMDKMQNRADFVPTFSFDFKVDKSDLVAMFWADEVDKCNFKEFGDVISFDATFRTNKYDMVFVPFTGIDNHLKSVTVGAGLLLREDTESYKWLLKSFMDAHKKQPKMIVTDQDGAMKRAIEAILPESKHRLCMWHILQKIPAKLTKEVYEGNGFKERFNKLVWNMFIGATEFEEKWATLLQEYQLTDQKWLKKMYNLREMWLPAYFIDSPLFGLMRTTSRSESENAFFKSFTNHGSTLVNFMMCYESAMERQRSWQDKFDYKTFDASLRARAKIPMEVQAFNIYTRTIFLKVQDEMYHSLYSCQLTSMQMENNVETTTVKDKDAGKYRTVYTEHGKKMVVREKDKVAYYTVTRNIEDGTIECSCRHFMRYGYQCRHVFFIWKNSDINVIPDKYILRRWRRDIIPPTLRRNTNRYGEKDEEVISLTNEANYLVDECVFMLRKDKAKLGAFVEGLKAKRKEIKDQMPNPPSDKTSDVIQEVYAVKKPKKKVVNNPQGASNKGFDRSKRLKSAREIAITGKGKTKRARKCLECGKVTSEHTKKTCPQNKKYAARIAAAAAQKAPTEPALEEALEESEATSIMEQALEEEATTS